MSDSNQLIAIIDLLNACVHNVPRVHVLADIQLIREQLLFSPESVTQLTDPATTKEEARNIVSVLFENEVSKEVYNFLDYCVRYGWLGTIASNSEEFVQTAHSYFYAANEAIFTSAISLSPAFQEEVTKILQQKNPSIARIIFQSDESTVAGFNLSIDQKEFDYSLRNLLLPALQESMKRLNIGEA